MLGQATLFLHLCAVLVGAAIEPLDGEASKTTFTSRGDTLTFPAVVDDNNVPHFSDNLNFDAVDDQILIGAADKLYVLRKDLTVQDNGVYTWVTTQDTNCPMNGNQCRNHIRIYQRRTNDPDSNSLFVCGTQSGIEPQCRVLNITESGLVETGDPTRTSLVSAHPDLPGFGEFRQENATDNIYFSANFRTTDTGSYDISYQQVDFSDNGTRVETSRLYGWLQTSTHWLNSPVVFVDYQRLDYGQPGDELLEYYFVFLREKQSRDTDVITRVLRLCRNDAGIALPTGQRVFTSYLKARIFCEREMPPGTEFVGAEDFQYDEMWSVAINKPSGGRYHETADYLRFAYGAFSGPRIGPVGTAICVYRADMTESTNGGIFDVFRNDVVNPATGEERENNYLMCNPQGRDVDDSQRIEEVQNVRQIGENPLLVFEGFYVTQMVVDQVCVVKRSSESLCVNQDVLFLGTSHGRVLKVVFVTDSVDGVDIRPVIAEEIKLNSTDDIKEMKIESDGSSKFLYVVTSPRIYRLPLERCSRHGRNITSCIGSRDPYCVWDSSQRCARSNLTADGALPGIVPVSVRQNIHTGNVTLPNVGFELKSYTTTEGSSERLVVTVFSDERVAEGVVEVDIINLTAKVGVQFQLPSSDASISLVFDQPNNGVYRQSFSIETRRDNNYRGNLQFQLSLRNTISGAVFFTQQNATVTIMDVDGTLFRVGFDNLLSDCVVWKANNPSALKNLVDAVAKGIGSGFPATNIINATLNCDKINDKYVTLVGAMLVTSELSTSDLLTALKNWVGTSPKIESPTAEVDDKCSVSIQSSVNSTCTANTADSGGVSPSVSPMAMTVLAGGLSAAFIITLVIAITLSVVVVILSFFLWRARNNTKCPSPEVAPEKQVYEETEISQMQSLADRRGSRELHLDIGQLEPFSSDTLNPKSSEPLLGNKTNVFFMDSGKETSTTRDCNVVHNTSAMEMSQSPDHLEKSSNGNVPLRGSIEIGNHSSELKTDEQPM